MNRVRALLVDDDSELARLLSEYLRSHDVEVDHVPDGAQALERLGSGYDHDIVLLDVMLPGADGFEVCRRIRDHLRVPIVMLTARGDDDDRVVGLDTGADDYVAKPFNPRELLARMHAVLRRAKAPTSDRSADRIELGDLTVDVPGHKATLAGRELSLTSFELRLLVALARRAGETVTREELASAVVSKVGEVPRYDPSVDRSLDVHVSHLRHKLGDDAREPKRIRTVRGVGYVLVRAP